MFFELPILTGDRDFAHECCIEDAALRLRLVENAKCLQRQETTWDQIATRFVEVLESVVVQRQANKGVTRDPKSA